MALRIMRLSEVKAVTGLSKTTIYRFEKEGRFPSRVSLGERSVGWFEDDIQSFLQSLGGVQTLRLAIEERNREIWFTNRGSWLRIWHVLPEQGVCDGCVQDV